MSKEHADELRRRAEELFAVRDSRIESLERADLASLAHELAVHQIELEIQNEELRRTRTLAEESRDRYLDLYDFAPVGYFTLDEHSRIVEANLTGCRLLNAERQALLKKRFTKFILDQETDKFYFHRKQVLEGGARQTCELRMQGASGAAFDARLESIRAAEGRLRVAVVDVTERKRAEESLRASEQRYHRLFEDDLTGDFISTPEGRILLCNPAFSRMFGYASVEEAVGTSVLELYVDPEEREPLLEQLKQQGKIERLEVWRKQRDGKRIYIVENLVGHFNERGELYEILGYLFDDTERKRAEEALRDLNAMLESKVAQRTAELEGRAKQLQRLTLELSQSEDRERRRIAEILHDDLQQVLAAAKFHLGLLQNRAAQDPERQATVAKVEAMLKDAIAKSRSLSHELSPAVLHRNDLTEILVWLAGQMRAGHGLTVRVDAPEEIKLQSEAITVFLFRAVQEMLFNVIKHAGVSEAQIRVRRRGRYVRVSISDRGRGFDAREHREAGGFGLFGIRERVELLGGRMRIRSHQGEGSTFHIVVPDEEVARTDVETDREPAGYVTRSEHVQGRDGPRLRVLLADDHQVVRQGIASMLAEEHDLEVVAEATNGREAVELADRLHPDVVIMDVSMPLMSGDEAARQIKRHLPQIRIVAISVYDDAEIIDKMRQAGAESYVSKTSLADDLLAAIRGKASD